MDDSNPTDPTQSPGGDGPRKGLRLFGRRPGLQSPNEALQPEAAPPPPAAEPRSARRSSFLSGLSGFLSFLLVVSVGLVVASALVEQRLTAPGPLQADKILVIAPRSEVSDILNQLNQEGVIDSSLLVNLALAIERNRGNLKAGEYLFRQNASAQEVIDTLVSGKQIMHSITVPEGLTTEQVLDRLRQNDILSGEIHEAPKEGALLPETYKFLRGMSRDALIRKMETDQQDALNRIWNQRSPDNPLKSPYELVTLASIVEKETGKVDERPRVAEVFLNRLQKHMRLQSDPTVVYGLVGGKGTLGRGILKAEVEQPTPYNTYVIDGLPPGPIANPGVAALEAVANPSRTKELYFVADGTGGHVFAETLDQHLKNVARWRQIEKDAQDKAPPNDFDHVPPPAVPPTTGLSPPPSPPRRDRRGENQTIGVPVFGALPLTFGSAGSPPQALAGIAAATGANGNVGGRNLPAGSSKISAADASPAPGARGMPSSASAFANFSMGPDLDQIGIAIQGVTTAASVLDGPVDSPVGSSVDTPAVTSAVPPGNSSINPVMIPVKPGVLADMRAREAKYGLPQTSNDLPPSAAVAAPAAPVAAAADTAPLPTQSASLERRHAPIHDASEGTKLDPLLNKNWDLNSPKTVPPMTTLPQSP
jgi:UPF0755 protein